MEKFIDLCVDHLKSGVAGFPPIPLWRIPSRINVELEYNRWCNVRDHGTFECEAFDRPENEIKNKSQSVQCWDHSRVKLIKSNSPSAAGSDYIHANYVTCFNRKRKFIATQAPISETLVDYFDMIWQNHCKIIVVLIHTSEENVANYYPYWVTEVNDVSVIDKYTLKTCEKIVKSDYVKYSLQLRYSIHPETCRNIILYHYTDWPANGTPSNFTGLIELVNEMNEHRLSELLQGRGPVVPIVVHGNEGVCRTVIFCTIDLCIMRWFIERRLRVNDTLITIHKMRYSKLISLDQYIFMWLLLIDVIRPYFKPANN